MEQEHYVYFEMERTLSRTHDTPREALDCCTFHQRTTTGKSAFGTGHGWPLVPVLTTGTRHPGPMAPAINTG